MTVFSSFSEFDKAFNKCVIRSRTIYGHCYKCPKGLWWVEGTDFSYVIRQAESYFSQYAFDGEYDDLIASGIK